MTAGLDAISEPGHGPTRPERLVRVLTGWRYVFLALTLLVTVGPGALGTGVFGKPCSVVAYPHLGELLSASIDQCNVVVVFGPVHTTEHWRR